MTTMTARDFNRDVSAAKRAAYAGPVMVTDRGHVSHVLLTAADYDRLRGAGSILDRLSMDEDIDLDVTPIDLHLRVPDL